MHSNDDANGRGAANEQHCKDIEPFSQSVTRTGPRTNL